ncbi:hypothetical protein SANTM175S_06043 [Streptomyces antimycoticus]
MSGRPSGGVDRAVEGGVVQVAEPALGQREGARRQLCTAAGLGQRLGLDLVLVAEEVGET